MEEGEQSSSDNFICYCGAPPTKRITKGINGKAIEREFYSCTRNKCDFFCWVSIGGAPILNEEKVKDPKHSQNLKFYPRSQWLFFEHKALNFGFRYRMKSLEVSGYQLLSELVDHFIKYPDKDELSFSKGMEYVQQHYQFFFKGHLLYYENTLTEQGIEKESIIAIITTQ